MKLTRKLLALSLTAACVAPLTACDLLNPGGGDETLTIYSNSLTDGRDTFLKEEAQKAGFKVQLVAIGGAEVYNRLVAEKANPVADLALGPNDAFSQKLENAGVLEPYKPVWADKLDKADQPQSESYWPIVREPIMFVCNQAAYPTPQQMPAELQSLWQDPQFRGKYEVYTNMGSATTQMVITSILNNYRSENGKYGISPEGWEAISQFYKQGQRNIAGTDLFARMKTGEVNCGQMWLQGKLTREKQYDLKTEAIRPPYGVPVVHQMAVIVKGSKKTELAKKFIDWFGSAEIQGEWSKRFGTAPTNSDADKLGNQEAIKYTDSFKPQQIDWKFVASNLDKWIEEIQLNYVK